MSNVIRPIYYFVFIELTGNLVMPRLVLPTAAVHTFLNFPQRLRIDNCDVFQQRNPVTGDETPSILTSSQPAVCPKHL
jgi:hypothetical protein